MNQNAALASWALYSELYNSPKYNSQHQILALFIKSAIVEEKLRSFSANQISDTLSKKFGFNIPVAVIKTSLKKIDEVKYTKGKYMLVNNIDLDDSLKDGLKDANDIASSILENFKAFIKNKKGSQITEEEIDDIVNDFYAYLSIDDKDIQDDNKLLISSYLLYCENDPYLCERLSLIRTGSLIYLGLNYNVENIPHVNERLVLYLATEILFFLAGYDGPIFKDLALEMISLIKDINKGKRTVEMRIFSATKDEIDRYFSTAETLVNGYYEYDQNTAMLSILKGCETKAEVSNKKLNSTD